jgi:hypothetical protein
VSAYPANGKADLICPGGAWRNGIYDESVPRIPIARDLLGSRNLTLMPPAPLPDELHRDESTGKNACATALLGAASGPLDGLRHLSLLWTTEWSTNS